MRIARAVAIGVVATLALTACHGSSSGQKAGAAPGAVPAAGTSAGTGGGTGGGTGEVAADGGAPTAPATRTSPSAAGPAAKGTATATAEPADGANPAADPATAPIPAGKSEVVRYGVPIGDYHALFEQAVAAKYRPVRIDGYDVGGGTYVAVVFRPAGSTSWAEYTEMSSSGYQSRFDQMNSAGYHLTYVDSYLHGGAVRYAAIWVKGAPAPYAFHGYTASAMQTLVNKEVAAGYLPVVISAVAVGGTQYFTGMMVKTSLGASWISRAALTSAQYTSLYQAETKAGLAPAYLGAYTVNGSVRYIALFASAPVVAYRAGNGLTAAQLGTQITANEKAGYRTGSIAGYDDGGSPRFVAYWSK